MLANKNPRRLLLLRFGAADFASTTCIELRAYGAANDRRNQVCIIGCFRCLADGTMDEIV